MLRDAGLADVEADAFFPMTGVACALLEQATMRQIRDRLISAGLATVDDVDQHRHNIATGLLDLVTSPMISAWGRRPA
ncbi:hypothetical protein [Micromonospora sp. SL4-19]|uniref:hypothetical protein n=1 Tax=Micromonospora sp. SL4-19 TaxID=3399129 RepID=UPI003A4E4B42